MNITSAKYQKDMLVDGTQSSENSRIIATIDGYESTVPLCVGNRHYDEIMRQVEAGTLTIQDAD